MKRVGFIVGNQLRQIRLLHADRIPEGDFGLMRFGWIAAAVNRRPECGLRYELYRPWRRYDALVFVKAMGPRDRALRGRARRAGIKTVFDANVNYYDRDGTFYYDGMAPTEQQRQEAEDMTRGCDAVIADSRFLAERCAALNPAVRWIPDNVDLALVPPRGPAAADPGRLELVWSGQAVKLFELLAIEDVLRELGSRIRLTLVTNSLRALDAWKPELRARFDRLLADVPHAVRPYVSVADLLAFYASRRCVCLSPRFADNSYNLGHTEWKIALALACGRLALAGPVPSYRAVAERSGGAGVWLCATAADWRAAFDRLLQGRLDWNAEEAAARGVVEKYYATEPVAAEHAEFMKEVLA